MLEKQLLHFFKMGGFGFYIWSAYGVVFAIVLINLFVPIYQRKCFLKQLRLMQNMAQNAARRSKKARKKHGAK